MSKQWDNKAQPFWVEPIHLATNQGDPTDLCEPALKLGAPGTSHRYSDETEASFRYLSKGGGGWGGW